MFPCYIAIDFIRIEKESIDKRASTFCSCLAETLEIVNKTKVKPCVTSRARHVGTVAGVTSLTGRPPAGLSEACGNPGTNWWRPGCVCVFYSHAHLSWISHWTSLRTVDTTNTLSQVISYQDNTEKIYITDSRLDKKHKIKVGQLN